MTLDELDLLTNPAIAQEEEDKRSRSNFRPPFTELTCDIGSVEGPYEVQDGQFVRKVAGLELRNIRNVKAVQPFDATEWTLEVRLPAKANIHSEATLMTASAADHDATISSIRHLANRKGVTLKEAVDHYQGRKQDPPNSGTWVDAPMETRYYAVVAIGATNGAKATAAPAFTDAELDEAADQIIGLSKPEASALVGNPILGKLLVGDTKRVKEEEGVLVAL